MWHTSSPKVKGQNLIISNSVAGAYLPACWLANPNAHRLLIITQLPTPALPNRLSLILLLEEFSWRSPVPIVNPLLKTVCVFVGKRGAQSYSDSPNDNKIPNNFRNWLLLLVLTCCQFDEKLNVGFEQKNNECSFALIVDSNLHVFFLTYWPTHIKWRLVMIPKSIINIMFFPMLVLIKIGICSLYFPWLIRKLWEKWWENKT